MKRIISREYGVQYTEISLRSLSPEVKDLVPYTFYEQVYVPEDNNEVCYIDEGRWNRLIDALKKRWNVKTISRFEGLFMKAGKHYVNFAEKISNMNLKDKSNRSLKRLYLEYQRLAVRYTSFIWTTFILNNLFSERARNIIQEYPKDEQPHYEAVFTPEKKAAILQLKSIVNRTNSRRLYERFKWIPCLDIHNPPWTFDEFMDYIRQMEKKGQKLISYQSLLKKLKPEDKRVLDVAKRFAYIKDLRDDFRRKAIYCIRSSLFKELAGRMDIKVEEASYLQERDIVNFLENGIKPEKIEERKKGFVMLYDSNKDLICVSGARIDSVKRKLGLTINEDLTREIKGIPASSGITAGRVTIVTGVKDLTKVKDGDILVAVTTHPDYVPAMQRAAGIITDEGGVTSHAAIVARELGIPCIVGTKIASKALKENSTVEMDANSGVVRKSYSERMNY